jgi:2-methylcitrate dehydratase PrpD
VAVDGLGQRYNILSITQKNHGCCGHTFAAIDAALALRQQGLRADDVAALRVDAYQTSLDVTGNFSPNTAFEAKFSLPYVVAHALVHGSVRLDAFGPDRLRDPQVRQLMQRLELRADPAFTAGFPRMRAARLTVTTTAGQVLEHHSPFRKGDPESPLSDADLADKFDELAGPVLGRARARALREDIWRLETMPVRALRLAADMPRL